jgi:RimJ/RimL family protein N-acetyltransferase
MSRYRSRPVTDADREFLLAYASAREIELFHGTVDEAMKRLIEHQFDAQSAHYASEYANARHEIITLAATGEPVGRVYVNRSDEQIAILDITILSEFRRRGSV